MADTQKPADIAQAIARVRDYFATHSDDARSTDSLAQARLIEGLRVRVEGPNGWTIDTDMATAVGGGGSAPSPGWLLRAAVASCDAVLIAMQAAEEGVGLRSLEADVTSESDDRGLVGLGDVPAGPLSLTLTVRIAGEGTSEQELSALVERALRRSPVSDALKRSVPVQVVVQAVP